MKSPLEVRLSKDSSSWPFATPGIGRTNTVSIQLKTVVLAAIPTASVSTATSVKPGLFSDIRRANRKSCANVRMSILWSNPDAISHWWGRVSLPTDAVRTWDSVAATGQVRRLHVFSGKLRAERIAEPRHRVPHFRPRIPERLHRPIPLHPVDPPRIEPQPDQPRLKKRHVLRRNRVELHADRQNRALRHLGVRREHRPRSEERRVGKECRSRWSPYH